MLLSNVNRNLNSKRKVNLMDRRDFIKSSAAAAACSVAGISLPSGLSAADEAEKGWRWDKAACRFCGTGCGIMVATKDGKIVAVKGDPLAPVNRGLNCIKGYFNAKSCMAPIALPSLFYA